MFGEPLKHLGETASTNDDAMLWAREGALHGSVVRADSQTRGRGRFGRDWVSPPNLGLYVSLILRPQTEIAQVSQLTMLAALASADAIYEQTGLPAQVKWPNDIVLHDKKVGGILSEAAFSETLFSETAQNTNIEYSKLGKSDEKAREFFVVVGIGLNVNFALENLPMQPKIPATSLRMESGELQPCNALFKHLMFALQRRYSSWENGGWHSLRAEFQERDFLQNKTVKVESGTETFRGRAVGIDADGILLVQTENGVRRVLAGDVKWDDWT